MDVNIVEQARIKLATADANRAHFFFLQPAHLWFKAS